MFGGVSGPIRARFKFSSSRISHDSRAKRRMQRLNHRLLQRRRAAHASLLITILGTQGHAGHGIEGDESVVSSDSHLENRRLEPHDDETRFGAAIVFC
jgi:hypothetical protein